MNPKPKSPISNLISSLIIGVGSVIAYDYCGPVLNESGINWISGFAAILGVHSGFVALSATFTLLSHYFEKKAVMIPKGLKGTAGFIESVSELKGVLAKKGPYWGVFKGKPLYIPYESNSYTLGPSGTGKTTRVVIPMVLSLKGKVGKFILDFKSELAPILAPALRKRGEKVILINLGNLFSDIVGSSDSYNPLCLVVDCYERPGGLLEIVDLLQELCLQLYPEPKGGKDDDAYFRSGSRRILSVAIQLCVIIEGPEANLGTVLQLINDRAKFRKHLQWLTGNLMDQDGHALPIMPIASSHWADKHNPEDLQNYIQYLTGQASALESMVTDGSDNKTFESFITGSQDALASFNITSLASKRTNSSSFRFSELKEGSKPVTVFIMIDSNKVNAQAPVLSLLQFCFLYEMKQHPNKHRVVHAIIDEATNVIWPGLGSLMTWSRSYGLRMHQIFQTYHAYKEAHGDNTLGVLKSESEIVQILAGQRNPETLEQISKMLAEQSLVVQNYSSNKDQHNGMSSYSTQEVGRPLLTADEIKRCQQTILLVRNLKPMLIDCPSVSEIAPFRKQIGVNPFHGKPFLKPIKLRLKGYSTPLVLRLFRWFFSQKRGEQ